MMTSFKTYLEEGNKLVRVARDLNQNGMEPVHKSGFGVVSAFTGDYSKAQNQNRHRALGIVLKHLGHSYTRSKGVYKGSSEDSMIVYPKQGQSPEDFKHTMVNLGKVFSQESILHYDGTPNTTGRIIATKPNAQWGDKTFQAGETMDHFNSVTFRPSAEDFKTEIKPGQAYTLRAS